MHFCSYLVGVVTKNLFLNLIHITINRYILNMNNTIINKPLVLRIFEDFRYDLLKAIAVIIFIAASLYYSNTESGKYYFQNRTNTTMLKK